MTKKIETLVQDIYNLFENNHEVNPENAKLFGEELSQIISNRLSRAGEDRRTLRLSMLGKPLREIWYELKGYPKEKIPPHTKIKFLYGDILECLLLFLAREAGHKVEEQQKEIMLEGIKGHQDARIDGVLIDVKSASTYGFQKFKEGTILMDDPFGYLEQLAGYMTDQEDKIAGWLAIDKTLGHLCLHLIHNFQMPDIKNKITRIKDMLKEETPPERCYKPIPEGVKGNLVLDTACSYCAFKNECWKDSNDGKGPRVFAYAKGPKFLVNIVDLPRVPEITKSDTDASENTTKEEDQTTVQAA